MDRDYEYPTLKFPALDMLRKKKGGILKLTWERSDIYFKMFSWEFLMLETWTPAVEHCHSVIIEFTISIFKLNFSLWWNNGNEAILKKKTQSEAQLGYYKGGLEICTVCLFNLVYFRLFFYYKGGRKSCQVVINSDLVHTNFK